MISWKADTQRLAQEKPPRVNLNPEGTGLLHPSVLLPTARPQDVKGVYQAPTLIQPNVGTGSTNCWMMLSRQGNGERPLLWNPQNGNSPKSKGSPPPWAAFFWGGVKKCKLQTNRGDPPVKKCKLHFRDPLTYIFLPPPNEKIKNEGVKKCNFQFVTPPPSFFKSSRFFLFSRGGGHGGGRADRIISKYPEQFLMIKYEVI